MPVNYLYHFDVLQFIIMEAKLYQRVKRRNALKAESTITIQRPIEEVFTYITNTQEVPKWSPVKELKQTSEGALGIGTTVTQVVEFLGRTFESTTEVTGYDPPKAFAFKATSGPVLFEQHFTLSSTGGGTTVNAVLEGEPGGLFKLAGPLLPSTAQKQFDEQLGKLEKRLEG